MSATSASPPSDANETCVGPAAEEAGKASSCAGCPNQQACASGEARKPNPKQAAVNETMSSVKRTLLVLSGKGGVGKSTFSAQLAFGLARAGKRVGLLDLDICGPSIPLMLGLSGKEVFNSGSGWEPVYVDADPDVDPDADADVEVDADADAETGDLGVMSIGFLMPDQDSAVIWRGPRKNGLIQEFFTNVHWGKLDYLVIDTPPGTSDEHISIVQLLKESLGPHDGAVVVTTPQEVAMMDVRKELNFCKQTKIPVLGVVENMATMHLPVPSLTFTAADSGADCTASVLAALKEKCPELLDANVELSVFPAAGGGPKAMADKFGVPFLGTLPMCPQLQRAGELGKAVVGGNARAPLMKIVGGIIDSEPETATAPAADLDSGSGVVSLSTAGDA